MKYFDHNFLNNQNKSSTGNLHVNIFLIVPYRYSQLIIYCIIPQTIIFQNY